MDDLQNIFNTARAAAQAGGEVLLDFSQRGFSVRSKPEVNQGTHNLVSDADEASERRIAEVILQTFPQHTLLGEEQLSGSVDAEHLWVIDPLDGTNNYVHAIPHYAVSIAYYHRGEGKCGVVYNPATGDWFTAIAGQKAWHNDREMHVSEAATLSDSLVACGFYYDRGDMMRRTLAAIEDFFGQQIRGMRRFGTAALDLCFVARGNFGVFFEYQLSPWDFAAGQIIVAEAGGRITDGHGRPLALGKSSVVASNGRLHDLALEVVTRHHPER